MAGAFDDLIPAAKKRGAFDDLIPQQSDSLPFLAARGATDSALETIGFLPDTVSAAMRMIGIPAPGPSFYTNKLKEGVGAAQNALSSLTGIGSRDFQQEAAPETTAERLAYGGGRGLMDAASIAAPAAVLRNMTRAGTLANNAGAALSAQPAVQAVAGVSGGAVGEATDNPYLGLLASVATPIVAGKALGLLNEPLSEAARRLVPQGVSGATANSAARYVGKVISSAGGSVDDLARNASSRPVTAAEAIGSRGETHLAALARRGGTTADELAANLTERTSGTGARMLDDIDRSTGIATQQARQDLMGFTQQLREQASPLFDAAYRTGVTRTRSLDAIFQAPTMKKALGYAQRIAADEYALARSQNRLGAADAEDWGKAVSQLPNKTAFSTRYLDYVKRGLDQVLEQYRDPITKRIPYGNPAVRAADQVRKNFREEVKRISPRYDEALNASGDYLSIEEAFTDGARALTNQSISLAQFQTMLGRMSSAEGQAFKSGIADSLFNLFQTGRLRPGTFNTPIMRGKLRAAFGDEAAQRIIDGAEQEAQMMRSANRMRPGAGSPTQELREAMAEQDGAGRALEEGINIATDAMTGGVGSAATSALGRGGRYLGGLARTGTMGEITRNEAGRLLQLPPRELAEYLRSVGVDPQISTRNLMLLLGTQRGIGELKRPQPIRN